MEKREREWREEIGDIGEGTGEEWRGEKWRERRERIEKREGRHDRGEEREKSGEKRFDLIGITFAFAIVICSRNRLECEGCWPVTGKKAPQSNCKNTFSQATAPMQHRSATLHGP